jgi:4-hydroxy-tetrahydrodipicolinate synthase
VKDDKLGRRGLIQSAAVAAAGFYIGRSGAARAESAAEPKPAPAPPAAAPARKRLEGVLAPVLTPFNADLSPDTRRWARHCRWLLKQGCRGLAIFGTTSEANSLTIDERERMLDALLAEGVDPSQLLPGTGTCAIPDTVRLTKRAVNAGCAGVLMLPPFYYKDVSDEGLYRTFASVIDRVGDARLRIYLYHIPPVSRVGISLPLIERLLKAYPAIIAGMKDSSGDWNNTKAALAAFGRSGFDVFVGSEKFLLANLRGGGVGTITATANVNPAAIDRLYRSWRSPEAEQLQESINVIRSAFEKQPAVPGLKAAVAHYSGDAGWRTVRPPLVELTEAQTAALHETLQQAGFAMPGLQPA